MLNNKKIVLGVCGGIAAYKTLELASFLKKRNALVKIIATPNSLKFVQPLSWKSITHDTVISDMFDVENEIAHIQLADWADLFIIAPATANTIAKIALGMADNLLTTTLLAYTKKVLIVPAMNVHMYENDITQKNIARLQSKKYCFMEPETGKLACGYEGKGRFPETKEIMYFAESLLQYDNDLLDKKIMITAGSTIQKIDPMRYLTNRSSGKMGVELARSAAIRGAKVTLVAGNVSESIPKYIDSVIKVESAEEMFRACKKEAYKQDIIVKAAAVSDYTPIEVQEKKIKKSDDLTLQLVRTKDILAYLGKTKKENQIVVGFAAETDNIIENAKKKLITKNCNYIVANNLQVAAKDDTEVAILSEKDQVNAKGTKFEVANKIWDTILYEK